MPLTICWCFTRSYLYFTMNETIEANLKARPRVNTNAPRNPDIAPPMLF